MFVWLFTLLHLPIYMSISFNYFFTIYIIEPVLLCYGYIL
ncbi:hypothetical protein [Staphylococcus phage vB_SauM-V1SA19]|nr:hypothetical protein [Staphylococcus phage vB_SauM-V1SA19]